MTIKERIEEAGIFRPNVPPEGAFIREPKKCELMLEEAITVITELEERIAKLEDGNPPLEITDDRIKEMFERAERGECSCGCHVSKDKEDFKDGCDICKDNH